MASGQRGSLSRRALSGPEQGGNPRERIRVLLVGNAEAVPGLEPFGEEDPMHVVGRVEAIEEVVPAVDTLQPHVLVLSSTLLRMASRMAACPASVVVILDRSDDERRAEGPMGSEAHILKLALLLAAARR